MWCPELDPEIEKEKPGEHSEQSTSVIMTQYFNNIAPMLIL
jgi:hypothetical protein